MAASSRSFFGTIRSRLIFGSLGLSLIPLILISAVVGILATRLSGDAIETRVKDQLRAVHAVKSNQIRDSFGALASALRSLSSSEDVVAAVPQLTALSSDLASRLAASTDAQRQAVNAYYNGDFEREFGTRNNGAKAGIADAMRGIPPKTLAMQYLYIARNPNPLGSKNLLLSSADDPSGYSALHNRLQPQMRYWIREYGFYDIFLVDPNGDIVYTYFKELDFGTNLRNGPWAKTPLGEAFRQASQGSDPRGVYLSDFAPYRPSYDDQAAFLSTPLFERGRRVGVLIAQMPIDRINAVLNFGGDWQGAGLGKTGETVLLGADGSHRTDSRRLSNERERYFSQLAARGVPAAKLNELKAKDSTIGIVSDASVPAKTALAGQNALGEFDDYLGTPVLAAAGPVDALNRRFGFVVKLDQEEAYGPIVALTRQIGGAAIAALALLGLIAAFVALRLARSINTPLAQVQDTVQKVSAGDLDARTGLQSGDEIGQLAKAFDGLLDEKVTELARAQKENEQLNNSVIEIMMSVAQLAQRDLNVKVPVSEDVTGAVSDAINMMTTSTAGALRQVNAISAQVSDSSGKVRERADMVLKLADEASNQANAASAELSSTANALRQIGEQAQGAGREAERALTATGEALNVVRATVDGITNSRDQIRETEKRVKRLAERSQEISSAVTIIGQIAERTSVLALNASMQAVAAGEAGRGFAVVADEVKRLAENAREATQQIAGLVNAIQSDTTETLQAMNGTIAQVVDITKLADRAGAQMNDTRAATEALVNSVRTISQATQTQGEASQRLLARAYELISASQRTLEEIELQRGDTEQLAESATSLVRTVSEFQLPG
jgi:methyl-accepting chemotaxis protein